MNSINIVGRLTAEPELRRTGDGTAVCSYSLAVKRPKVKDTTDFIACVTWRQGAEYLSQYGHKGDIVAVNGALCSRKWTDKEGRERKEWEVVTESVELLSSKRNEQTSDNTTQGRNGYPGGGYQPQQSFGQYQRIDAPDANLPF
jgi:single-strand DNA-binding protein